MNVVDRTAAVYVQVSGFSRQLGAWSKAFKLNSSSETAFDKAVGGKILVIKEISANVAILEAVPITENIYAVTYRWDMSKLKHIMLCVVSIGGKECFYWFATVESGVHVNLNAIPLHRGGAVWMDQICIPQHSRIFKPNQIQTMGELYMKATSVICGPNCVSNVLKMDDYLSRAWTQQEFSFGKVILHPNLTLTVKQKIDLIVDTFNNCNTIRVIVEAAMHRSNNQYWIPSAEKGRIVKFDSELGDSNPRLKAQVHHLWDHAWETADPNAILTKISEFRKKCMWDGTSLFGAEAFLAMFYKNCEKPMDQLHGMMGVVIFTMRGTSLPYNKDKVEECYRTVLSTLNLPLIICSRDDGDGTGKNGFLTPLRWRENRWDVHYPATSCSRIATHSHSIPPDFPQLSEYGHHFTLSCSIELWTYAGDDGSTWWAIGVATSVAKREGKVLIAMQVKSVRDWRDLICRLLLTELEKRKYFVAGPHACNWRLLADFAILLESFERDGKYRADRSKWTIC